MAASALLLRHGETEWNRVGRLQGWSDIPLCEAGCDQARVAAGRLPRFAQIICSPLRRATATAAVITEHQPTPVTLDRRLIERSWGQWEGLLPSEVDERYPGARASGRKPLGYELDEHVWQRVHPLLEELTTRPPSGPILLMTHGGLIMTIVRHLGGSGPSMGNLEGQWIDLSGPLALGPRCDYGR